MKKIPVRRVWTVHGRVRPDTVNMLEIVGKLSAVGETGTVISEKETVLCAIPWVGNARPEEFYARVNIVVPTAVHTLSAVAEVPLPYVHEESFQASLNLIVRDTMACIKKAVIGPDGKRVVKTERDGAILAVDPASVQVQGFEDKAVVPVDPAIVAEADATMDAINAETVQEKLQEAPAAPSGEPLRPRLLLPD
jgi:hypothetical protein